MKWPTIWNSGRNKKIKQKLERWHFDATIFAIISSILWQSDDYLMQHMIKSRIMQFRFWAAKYRQKLQIRVNWKTIKKKLKYKLFELSKHTTCKATDTNFAILHQQIHFQMQLHQRGISGSAVWAHEMQVHMKCPHPSYTAHLKNISRNMYLDPVQKQCHLLSHLFGYFLEEH